MRQNGVPEEICPAPHAEAFQNWNVAMYKFCHIMSQHVVGALWELQTEIRNAKYETGSEHVKRFIQTIYERLCSLQEPKEGFKSLIASGIYTRDGKLAKEYGG